MIFMFCSYRKSAQKPLPQIAQHRFQAFLHINFVGLLAVPQRIARHTVKRVQLLGLDEINVA